jgi:peptidyl-prolyl cis-trans isomerase family protein
MIINSTKTNDLTPLTTFTTDEGVGEKNMCLLLQKTQTAKEQFLSSGIKPTGYNSYQKYHYFSLDDIVPEVVKICCELGLATQFKFTKECGKLLVIDLETGCKQVFTTPLPAPTNNKATEQCKEIQAIQTYSRRALYLQWLEIVEVNSIELENTSTKQKKKGAKKAPQHVEKSPEPSLEEWGFRVQKELERRNQQGTSAQIKKVCKDLVGENSSMYWELLKAFKVSGTTY